MKSLLASAAFVATVALTAHASADEPTPAAPAAPPAPQAAEGAKVAAQTTAEQAQKAAAPKAEEKKAEEKKEEKKEPEDTHIRDFTVLLKVGAATTGDHTQDSGPASGGFSAGIDGLYGWKSLRVGGSFFRSGGADAMYNGSILAGAGLREGHVILRFLLEGGVHGYSVRLPESSQRGGGTVAFLGGRLDLGYVFGDVNAKFRPEVGVGLVMQQDLSKKHVSYTTTMTDRFTDVTTVSNRMVRVGGESAALFLNVGGKFNL